MFILLNQQKKNLLLKLWLTYLGSFLWLRRHSTCISTSRCRQILATGLVCFFYSSLEERVFTVAPVNIPDVVLALMTRITKLHSEFSFHVCRE